MSENESEISSSRFADSNSELVAAGVKHLAEGGYTGNFEVTWWDGRPMLIAASTAGYVYLVTIDDDWIVHETCFEDSEFAAVRRAMDRAESKKTKRNSGPSQGCVRPCGKMGCHDACVLEKDHGGDCSCAGPGRVSDERS